MLNPTINRSVTTAGRSLTTTAAPLMAALFLFTACTSDADILAKYTGGTITRGELKSWQSNRPRHGDVGANGHSRLHLHDERDLKLLCIEKLARAEARKTDYDKSEAYRLRLERAVNGAIARVVVERSRAALKKTVKTSYVECRFLSFIIPPFRKDGLKKVPLTVSEKEKATAEAMNKARHAVALLQKGSNFAGLAKSTASNSRGIAAEGVVYVLPGTLPPEIEAAVFVMKKGNFSSEPHLVSHPGAVMIFQVVSRGEMRPDDVKKQVTDRGEAQRVNAWFEAEITRKFLSRLEEHHGGKFNESSFSKALTETAFTVGEKNFTLDEVSRRYNFFMNLIGESAASSEKGMREFARHWYLSLLYRMEAQEKGWLEEEDFSARINYIQEFTLAHDYLRHVGEKEIVLTPRDIAGEYAENKKKYKLPVPGKKREYRQLSLKEAAPYIKKGLTTRRGRKLTALWRKKALVESGFQIAE